MYPATKFQNQLEEMFACEPARKWVGKRTAKRAYAECTRLDWMIFLARKCGVDGDRIAEAAMFATMDLASGDTPEEAAFTFRCFLPFAHVKAAYFAKTARG